MSNSTQLTHLDYETPADVLADAKLSKARKIEILEDWIEDAEAEARAAEEGMVIVDDGVAVEDDGEVYLRAALQALATLKDLTA